MINIQALRRISMRTSRLIPNLHRVLLAFTTAFALVACGGGGGDSGGGRTTGGGGSSGPGAGATPTAIFTASSTLADDAIAEANAGLASAAAISALPDAVTIGSLPSGVVTDVSSSICSSGSATVDVNGTPNTSGYSVTEVFTNCNLLALSGYIYNGTFKLTFTRYASASDYDFTLQYTNFTLTTPSVSVTTPLSGSYACTVNSSTTSCSWDDGVRSWSSSVTYSGGTLNGYYTTNWGGGVVKVTFTNYTATSGTVTIEGASPSRIVITRCGASNYTVSITNSSSVTSSYSVGTGCST
jgi:hypothetical protein